MAGILGGEDDLVGGNAPVDAERGVVPGDGPFRFGCIEGIALVLEDRRFGKDGKAMGKAPRDEDGTVVLARQFHGDMPSERRTPLPDIHSHIQDLPPDTAHQLALAARRFLEMESPHHAVGGHAFVVLHKPDRSHFLVKLPLGETFEKVTARIPEHPGFNDYYALDICLYNIHCINSFLVFSVPQDSRRRDALFPVLPPVALDIGNRHVQIARELLDVESDQAAENIPQRYPLAERNRPGRQYGGAAPGHLDIGARPLDKGFAVAVHPAGDPVHEERRRVASHVHLNGSAGGPETQGLDGNDPVFPERQAGELRPGRLPRQEQRRHDPQDHPPEPSPPGLFHQSRLKISLV